MPSEESPESTQPTTHRIVVFGDASNVPMAVANIDYPGVHITGAFSHADSAKPLEQEDYIAEMLGESCTKNPDLRGIHLIHLPSERKIDTKYIVTVLQMDPRVSVTVAALRADNEEGIHQYIQNVVLSDDPLDRVADPTPAPSSIFPDPEEALYPETVKPTARQTPTPKDYLRRAIADQTADPTIDTPPVSTSEPGIQSEVGKQDSSSFPDRVAKGIQEAWPPSAEEEELSNLRLIDRLRERIETLQREVIHWQGVARRRAEETQMERERNDRQLVIIHNLTSK